MDTPLLLHRQAIRRTATHQRPVHFQATQLLRRQVTQVHMQAIRRRAMGCRSRKNSTQQRATQRRAQALGVPNLRRLVVAHRIDGRWRPLAVPATRLPSASR